VASSSESESSALFINAERLRLRKACCTLRACWLRGERQRCCCICGVGAASCAACACGCSGEALKTKQSMPPELMLCSPNWKPLAPCGVNGYVGEQELIELLVADALAGHADTPPPLLLDERKSRGACAGAGSRIGAGRSADGGRRDSGSDAHALAGCGQLNERAGDTWHRPAPLSLGDRWPGMGDGGWAGAGDGLFTGCERASFDGFGNAARCVDFRSASALEHGPGCADSWGVEHGSGRADSWGVERRRVGDRACCACWCFDRRRLQMAGQSRANSTVLTQQSTPSRIAMPSSVNRRLGPSG
jgi:hypothetical protein